MPGPSRALGRALEGLPRALKRRQARLALFHDMAQAPDLFDPWWHFTEAVLTRGHLSPRAREIVVLRTLAHDRCSYELGNHLVIALGLGLSRSEIECVVTGGLGEVGETEGEVLRLADAILGGSQHGMAPVEDTPLPIPLRVEVAFLVGNYRLLAGMCTVLSPELEPWQQDLLRSVFPAGAAGFSATGA